MAEVAAPAGAPPPPAPILIGHDAHVEGTVMQAVRATAKATATARPGPLCVWDVSAGRYLLATAIEAIFCAVYAQTVFAATGAGARPRLPWRGRERAQHCGRGLVLLSCQIAI